MTSTNSHSLSCKDIELKHLENVCSDILFEFWNSLFHNVTWPGQGKGLLEMIIMNVGWDEMNDWIITIESYITVCLIYENKNRVIYLPIALHLVHPYQTLSFSSSFSSLDQKNHQDQGRYLKKEEHFYHLYCLRHDWMHNVIWYQKFR